MDAFSGWKLLDWPIGAKPAWLKNTLVSGGSQSNNLMPTFYHGRSRKPPFPFFTERFLWETSSGALVTQGQPSSYSL
jgi:hypothetical protein